MRVQPQHNQYDVCIVAAGRSTAPRAFEKPETGRIAVKVINHYGDEVLEVVPVT